MKVTPSMTHKHILLTCVNSWLSANMLNHVLPKLLGDVRRGSAAKVRFEVPSAKRDHQIASLAQARLPFFAAVMHQSAIMQASRINAAAWVARSTVSFSRVRFRPAARPIDALPSHKVHHARRTSQITSSAAVLERSDTQAVESLER